MFDAYMIQYTVRSAGQAGARIGQLEKIITDQSAHITRLHRQHEAMEKMVTDQSSHITRMHCQHEATQATTFTSQTQAQQAAYDDPVETCVQRGVQGAIRSAAIAVYDENGSYEQAAATYDEGFAKYLGWPPLQHRSAEEKCYACAHRLSQFAGSDAFVITRICCPHVRNSILKAYVVRAVASALAGACDTLAAGEDEIQFLQETLQCVGIDYYGDLQRALDDGNAARAKQLLRDDAFPMQCPHCLAEMFDCDTTVCENWGRRCWGEQHNACSAALACNDDKWFCAKCLAAAD